MAPHALSGGIPHSDARYLTLTSDTHFLAVFPLVGGMVLICFLLLAGVFALINVISLILAATAVDQALFVPATVMATIIVNMITGLIIWEVQV